MLNCLQTQEILWKKNSKSTMLYGEWDIWEESKTEKPLSRLRGGASSLVIDQGKGVLMEPSSRYVIQQVKSASP